MGMYGELRERGFELVSDTSVADWATRRQSGDVYRVDFQVPAGFEKYCRVLHRVHGPSDGDPSDSFLPWSDYAQSEVVVSAIVSDSQGEFVTTVDETPDMVRIDLRRRSDGLICTSASKEQTQRLEFRVRLSESVGSREVSRAGPGR